MAGLFGVFPVNASPPLTGIVAETGGRSKFAGIAAVALILGIAGYRTPLLAHVPLAALAGTLLFVAMRIVRVRDIITIFRRAFGEFILILATLAAIVVLPVGTGVAIGIVLSLLHGIWAMTRGPVSSFSSGFLEPRFGGRRATALAARRSKACWSLLSRPPLLPQRL